MNLPNLKNYTTAELIAIRSYMQEWAGNIQAELDKGLTTTPGNGTMGGSTLTIHAKKPKGNGKTRQKLSAAHLLALRKGQRKWLREQRKRAQA